VLAQTFTDFEIILVDDGSPDECPQICDEYAAKDSRIAVIHKENGGLSSARNAGMKKAQGKYIIFLDSDDYWSSMTALKEIYNLANSFDYDIISIKHKKYFEKTGEFDTTVDPFSETDFISCQYTERLAQLISRQIYDSGPWNKVFKRKLIENSDLFFVEGIIAEDIDWVARLSLAASSIGVIEKVVHVYRKGRPGAATSSWKLKTLVDIKDSIMRCLSYPELEKKSEMFKKAYYSYLAYQYVIWMAGSVVVKDKGTKPLIKEMYNLRWLLEYDLNRKVHLVHMVDRICGVRISRLLLGAYLSKKM
jgi:glycosyltransferase involved in cell wall biosynthesis